VILDKSYELWKAVYKDDHNGTLQHVSVERLDETSGLAIAADGWMLAVVPVELDEDDVPGLVHWTILAGARKHQGAAGKRDPWLVLMLDDSTVSYPDGARMPRTPCVREFPNWRGILEQVSTGEALALQSALGLNPALLAALGCALGLPEGPLLLAPSTPSGPILVETERADDNGNPTPPYGLLMPMVAREGQTDRARSALPKREVARV